MQGEGPPGEVVGEMFEAFEFAGVFAAAVAVHAVVAKAVVAVKAAKVFA